jgi:hypothetical protein
VKDVTAKYAARWLSHTRKQRVDPSWWMSTLDSFASYNVLLEDEENEHIKGNLIKYCLFGLFGRNDLAVFGR